MAPCFDNPLDQRDTMTGYTLQSNYCLIQSNAAKNRLYITSVNKAWFKHQQVSLGGHLQISFSKAHKEYSFSDVHWIQKCFSAYFYHWTHTTSVIKLIWLNHGFLITIYYTNFFSVL